VRRPVVIVSNRPPVAFHRDPHGDLVARRGAGGLVSGLAPLVVGTDTIWVAAALGDADREAAAGGLVEVEGFRVRLLATDPNQFALAYDVVCNATLWFVHHGLFDAARRPVHDHRFEEAWSAYVAINDAFAEAVAEVAPEGAVVLVQDYHLYLVGQRLAELRPDLAAVHFSHTPFTGPDGLALLPDHVADALLDGLAAYRACGFHTRRWARRFEQCWDERRTTPAPRTFVAPLGPDPQDLASTADGAAARAAATELDALIGERRVIVRVDRIELSKNLLRGYRAVDRLLAEHPEWREQVVLGAFVYPSREGLPEYLAYRQEADALVAAINARWATADWTPIITDASDDYPRSVAALQRADVLLVNPLRDGLNLVAKEGPLLNQHDAVLVLSSEAGAVEELGEAAVVVNPFDVGATAEALHTALVMSADERAQRAAHLRQLAARHSPATWLAHQLEAVDEPQAPVEGNPAIVPN
jgi:trehalose 6-phosphate synthase